MKLRRGSAPARAAAAGRHCGFSVLGALGLVAGVGVALAVGSPAGEPAGPSVSPRARSPRSWNEAGTPVPADVGRPGLYWIYWTSVWEDVAARAAASGDRPVSPRAEARLRREAPALPAADPSNRPVPRAFLDHLRGLGLEVRFASRFLRAASAFLGTRDQERLTADPGVARLVPVATLRRPTEDFPRATRDDRDGDRFAGGSGGGGSDGVGGVGRPEGAWAAGDTLPDPRSLTREDYGESWRQCEQLGVATLHRLGYSGHGVLVCLLDGGFYLGHDAFARARVLATRDFAEHDSGVGYDPGRPADSLNTPMMEYHGTYTFSTLGGFTAGVLVGPAYRAQFALGRTEVVGSETRMEEDTYVAGLEWADSLGADVVSTSLGYLGFDDGFSYPPDSLDGRHARTSRVAAWLARRGVVLVTAMGNAGPGPATLVTPADAESVISVGAVDSGGEVAPFSSRGPNARGVIKPDVCARGEGTICASATARGAYTAVNGTSLATPLIGGLAALLLEAHPDWAPRQVQEALHRAGDQAPTPDNARGWGVPDGPAALGAFEPTDLASSELLAVRSVTWVEDEEPGSPVLRDAVASPGEHGRLRIDLVNDGVHPARAAWLALVLPPEGITAQGDSAMVGATEPGEVVTVAAGPWLAIAADHPAPQLARLTVRFRTDHGATYYRTVDLSIRTPIWQERPFPNPLVGLRELTLDLDQPGPGPVRVTVFDAAGRMAGRPFVLRPEFPQVRLSWTPDAALASGVYYLQVATTAGVKKHRFVLIR
jgi:hypothetical protein